ncbi:MAG: RluA family pseudouridine synthase [Gemmataceae bacterium]
MLQVLFEDNHCLAVLKPAGLLTQGVPEGLPSLEGQARAYLKERYHKLGRVYLGIPHRLDRPVSGVVLFARSSKAAARLAEQFRERQVEKVYWAIVERSPDGSGPSEAGTWEDWLLKRPEEARSDVVSADTPGARHARLSFRRLAEFAEEVLLEVRPETGRMHQIRVQTATRGWPVLGDQQYGARRPFGPEPAEPRDRRIALHGRALTFLHPIRYEPITVTAPVDEAWRSWVTE